MALGAQEWLEREARGERARPRGSWVGVQRVRVLIRSWGRLVVGRVGGVGGGRTRAVRVWIFERGSGLEE